MMKNARDNMILFLLLLAGVGSLHAADRAGVAAQVNPTVQGGLGQATERVIAVGSDVFRDERIITGDSGLTHLLFLDQSSLTIGPGSEVVIDRFVYDPDRNAGELVFSTAKGVMRFVGGALSKQGKVEAKTPLGSIGIRGAVVLLKSAGGSGNTTACMVYGDVIVGTHAATGQTSSASEHESCLTLTPQGGIEEHLAQESFLRGTVLSLRGPEYDDDSRLRVRHPQNLQEWSRQVRLFDDLDRQKTDTIRPFSYPVTPPSPDPELPPDFE